MSELKPCPFCTTGTVYEQVKGGADDYRWAVGCSNLDCVGSQSLKTYSTRKDAAEAWNSRPIEDALVEALDVWDVGEVESLYSLLTNRVSQHTESGNVIIEDGAYTMLLRVIEKQRLTTLIQAGVKDE